MTRRALIAILIAAVLPYVSTVDDYFARDDFGVVRLLSSKPATWFPRWFVTSWMETIWGYLPDEVRPFPAVSYQITALWGAASPIGHHLFNILIHAGNGMLVYALARTGAGLGSAAALVAGLAFVLLPVHTESVAWVTGRVDTMPAFFYLASLVAYTRWRTAGSTSGGLYALSITLLFMALFSKQNTITMVASLVTFDVLVGRTGVGLRWSWIRPYVPFLLLTAGYLWLRYVLFGEVVREGQLDRAGLEYFVVIVARHLAHVVTGTVEGLRGAAWLALAAAAVPVTVLLQRGDAARGPYIRAFLYFGPVWWLIGVAPIAVAAYQSPRHVYLAAVGWAVVIGIGWEIVRRRLNGVAPRWVPTLVATALLGVYATRLVGAVGEYNALSDVSQRAVGATMAEANAARSGTLVIVDVPPPSWEWALPFAVQPPFTAVDATARVFVVSPRRLHCCRGQWFDDTRRALRAWAAGPAPDQVVLLGWDGTTGAASRAASADNAEIALASRTLVALDDPNVLDLTLRQMVRGFSTPLPPPDDGRPGVRGSPTR